MKKKAVRRMGGGMMGPKKKMARGGDPAKEIAKTKIGLHKLDAMGMLGGAKGAMSKIGLKGLKGLVGKMKKRKKKQGYKDRKDESIAERRPKKRTKKQLRDSANESYGKFGKGTGKGVINKRGGGVARRGMGKAK